MWARVDRALNGVKQHGTRGGTDTSPRKWALRRECLARMWARPRQGTLRFVIWGPSADVLALPGVGGPASASRRRLRSQTHDPLVPLVPACRGRSGPWASVQLTMAAALASPHVVARRTARGAWS